MSRVEIDGEPIDLRRAAVDEILPLRHAVLIAGTDRTTPHFDGDDATDTFHLGAFTIDGACVGCMSLMRSRLGDRPAYQLRGMATAPAHRGRGLGAAMLAFAEQQVGEQTAITALWCNARTPAAGFYQRHGWRRVAEPFDIPGVGEHVRMKREMTNDQ